MEFELPPRYWAKVRKAGTHDCWEWTGSRDQKGYGLFRLDGRLHRAHRLSLAADRGLPEGAMARHKCDNPPCCNPRHLEPGSASDNIADCKERGRRASMRGSANNASKVTDEDVIAMRRAYDALPKSPLGYTKDGASRALADQYGLTYRCFMQIVSRETWNHI